MPTFCHKAHGTTHPNWTANRDDAEGLQGEGCATWQVLFVGHGEYPVPAGRRLIEEIFLAAFPISARRAVIGPLVQNGLERFLGVFPAALAVEFMGRLEELEAVTHFVRGAVNRVFRGAANKFVDGHRLELAFYTNEIQFAKDVA